MVLYLLPFHGISPVLTATFRQERCHKSLVEYLIENNEIRGDSRD
jgi:hypothetical protein